MTKEEKAIQYFKKHLQPSEKLLWAGQPSTSAYTIPIALCFCFSLGYLCYLIYLRTGLEPSWSGFLQLLYISIPAIICLSLAVFFIKKEDQAYGFTEQQFLIKKGNGKVITIYFQDIEEVNTQITFLGWWISFTVLVTDKTTVYRLHSLLNGEDLDKKLRSYKKNRSYSIKE
jgi:hypothetical protein